MKILVTGGNKSGITALTFAIANLYPNHEVITEPPELAPHAARQDDLIVKYLRPEAFRSHQIDFEKFDVKVLIVRHPFDRMVSALYYGVYEAAGFSNDRNVNRYLDMIERRIAGQYVNFGQVDELYTEITGRSISAPILVQTAATLDLYRAGLGFQALRYEDFVVGNTSAIDGLFTGPVSASVTVPERVSRVSRSRTCDEWHAWFSAEDAARFGAGLQGFADTFGYTLSPPADGAARTVPEGGVAYIVKLVNEARERNRLPAFVRGEVHVGEEGDLFGHAMVALRRNKMDMALSLMEEAAQLRPDLPTLFFGPLRHLLRARQDETALRFIDLAARYEMLNESLVNVAIWHLSKRDTRAALGALRDCLDRHGLRHPAALSVHLGSDRAS